MFNTDDVTILFAGAGAGKTTRLIREITNDLKEYRPQDIAFVSYTRTGAYEGRDRVVKKLSIEPDDLVYFKTLHALTYSELGYSDKKVFTYKYAQMFNETLGFNLTTSKHDESNTLDDKLMNLYDQRRSGHSDLNADIDGFDKLRYDRLIKAYEVFKKHHGLVDYTDCLVDFVKRGKPVPVRVAYIDEAQDLTTLQWEVCAVAFSKAEKIFIAGDDYQSIYKYAGARPDVLIAMAEKHKVVKLEVSYRLPKSVYHYAKAITDILSVKVDKDYRPFKDDDGSVRFINDRRIMSKIVASRADEGWLVLFRTNYHAAEFEEYLKGDLVPYHTS
jgi:DNA helicase II / ATP-dependent DNA helicase PcrA